MSYTIPDLTILVPWGHIKCLESVHNIAQHGGVTALGQL